MKKIFCFVILSGFFLMLGAAGSADFANMSFLNVMLLELLGMFLVLFGTSALMHYKKYVRKMMRRRAGKRTSLQRRMGVAVRVRIPEKELC